MSFLKAANDGKGVKDGSAASVNEKDPFFHFRKSFLVHEVAGGGQERNVKGQDVGLPKKGVRGDVVAELGDFRIRSGIVSDNFAPKAGKVFHHFPANRPRAVNTDRLIPEFEAFESFEFKITLPNPLISPRNPAGHAQENGQGKFRDGIRGVGRNGSDGDPKLLGGGQVDVVGAGAEGGDHPGAKFGEDFEAGAVHLVVYEDQGSSVTSAERGGGGFEFCLEEFKMMPAGGVFCLKGRFEIGARAKNQRFHDR